MKIITPEKPSDIDLCNVIIDLSRVYMWHGYDLPVPGNENYVPVEQRKKELAEHQAAQRPADKATPKKETPDYDNSGASQMIVAQDGKITIYD
jgi:hypothetical protein